MLRKRYEIRSAYEGHEVRHSLPLGRYNSILRARKACDTINAYAEVLGLETRAYVYDYKTGRFVYTEEE